MSTENEFRHTENTLFSECLDILVQWGQLRLLMQDNDAFLQELEGQWAYLNAVSPQPDFGLDLFEGKTEAALALLHGRLTVGMDMDTEDADQVMTAMGTLDQVIFLVEAVDAFPDAGQFPKAFQEKVRELLRQVTIDRPPPGLRLIPLNQWRQDILKVIPSHIRYLFPWYASWAELDPDALDALAAHWDAALRGQANGMGIPPGTLGRLMAELGRDAPLLAHVQRKARQRQHSSKAAGKRLPGRLLALCEASRSEQPVPNGPGEADLLLAACLTLDVPVRSETGRAELIFLAAFCAPFPDARYRISLFSETERFLKRIPPSALPSGSLMESVYRWAHDRLSDRELIRKAFEEWEGRLGRTNEVTAPEILFTRAVEKVRNAPVPGHLRRSPDGVFRNAVRSAVKYIATRWLVAVAAACLLAALAFFTIYPPAPSVPPPPKPPVKKDVRPATSPAPQAPAPAEEKMRRNRPDPFQSPFDGTEGDGAVTTETGAVPLPGTLPQTPSDRATAEEFRLMGILLTPDGHKALMKAPDGRGYLLGKGLSAGFHKIRVTEIFRDRVMIEERQQDGQGSPPVRKRVLTLQGEAE
ncbi:hypothetical protein DENIS_3732 [Desulfonema ishimotonii]|uniref:Uncharacterized protein n=1 Tax=Desulfonema ishimotonii TaxID=45657 RepID=A0A401G0K2_9BACT|nr:type III-E CRISPR-associated protein Csx30 [Desulfonema ishimotonii]GBC62755.1 hypothetical protein DENIS_3732 [Desulfonema ishimotonii]